jgi:murein DD-endopeptidase MepM/ murein hydrolase activator NlpD
MRRRVFTSLLLAALTLALAAHVSPAVAQRTYTVREGDTLARIARRYHTTITAIREANELHGDSIRPGQELAVPRPGEPTTVDPHAGPTRVQRQAAARADRLGIGRSRTGHSLLTHAPERRWIVAAGAPRGLTGTLMTPVPGGRFIRGWGSGAGGYHLAMDIRGRPGQTIRACERGIVVYAGDQVSGYGNFVMVLHPNGWVTAYAHNQVNLVVAGQTVTRGERIALLGNTGLSHGPHLHFMLIHDGQHCDPAPLFRPHLGPRTPEVQWRRARRPDEVQCLPRSARPHPGHARREHGEEEGDADGGEGDDDLPAESEDSPDEPAAP